MEYYWYFCFSEELVEWEKKSHFILAILNGKRLGDQLTKFVSDGISE